MTIMEDENIAKELPIFLSTITTLNEQITDSTSHVKSLIEKISEDDETDRSEGLSFLEMKVHLVLEYLINLIYTMLLKIDGHTFDEQPCIERLVEIRTVLEKIRPINKKLSYQIDKLIKLATTELSQGELHPLSFKPNLANLANKDGVDDNEYDQGPDDDTENATAGQQSVYVPPRVTAVPYDEDNLSKKEKKAEKARQRSLNSTLLQDLRSEYGEAPDEIIDDRKGRRRENLKKREEERERFEEDNMRRLTVTKQDKMLKRKMNELEEVIKLGSFHGGAAGGDSADESDSAMYRPPKSSKKISKGGKFDKAKKFKKRMQKKRR